MKLQYTHHDGMMMMNKNNVFSDQKDAESLYEDLLLS